MMKKEREMERNSARDSNHQNSHSSCDAKTFHLDEEAN
jgi:hypothetical protein